MTAWKTIFVVMGLALAAAPVWAGDLSLPNAPVVAPKLTPEQEMVGTLASCAALEFAFSEAANNATPPQKDNAQFSNTMGQVFGASAEYYARKISNDPHAYVVDLITKGKPPIDDLFRTNNEGPIKGLLMGCGTHKADVDKAMEALRAENPPTSTPGGSTNDNNGQQ